jgi:hypothetical protein
MINNRFSSAYLRRPAAVDCANRKYSAPQGDFVLA